MLAFPLSLLRLSPPIEASSEASELVDIIAVNKLGEIRLSDSNSTSENNEPLYQSIMHIMNHDAFHDWLVTRSPGHVPNANLKDELARTTT
jgi:hypothetical protein